MAKQMHEKLKGIAEYFVREALYGWYNNRDHSHGDEETAVMRAYYILMRCIKNDMREEKLLAHELAKAILTAFWGRPLTGLDIAGVRFTRACLEVYNALTKSIQKTYERTLAY